jgi:tripartite-type tricarboxylate transporter receptor subunit TctC
MSMYSLRAVLITAGLCVPLIQLGSPQATGADGASYPTKVVRMIVPVVPGGALDTVGRAISNRLTKAWGQPVIVENKPGANSSLGGEIVAHSDPDGYTLIYTTSGAITINPLMIPNMAYNPLKDLVPITLAAVNPYVLLVSSKLNVKTANDFVALLRANSGKFNHGSSSAGSLMSSELLKSLASLDYADVNYRGSAAAVMALATGEVDFAFVEAGSAMAQMNSNGLRALAVSTPQRSKLLPDIPTLAESGVPGYASGAWTLFQAPAKTPPGVVTKINGDIKQALFEPEIVKILSTVGSEPVGSSSEVAARELQLDADKWSRVVKERNIKFQ